MAIGVTRAALRLAPGAVNRSGERGVRGCRASRTQQCEECDPDGGKHQAHSIACGRNGEKFDRALPPYSMERISISWSPTKTISRRLCRLEPAPSGRRAGIRAECPQITLFEASFGFQCSAHSSDGEFPLEL